MVDNEELDIEEVMVKLNRIENKIKFEAFGKTTKKEIVSRKEQTRPNGLAQTRLRKQIRPSCLLTNRASWLNMRWKRPVSVAKAR